MLLVEEHTPSPSNTLRSVRVQYRIESWKDDQISYRKGWCLHRRAKREKSNTFSVLIPTLVKCCSRTRSKWAEREKSSPDSDPLSNASNSWSIYMKSNTLMFWTLRPFVKCLQFLIDIREIKYVDVQNTLTLCQCLQFFVNIRSKKRHITTYPWA